MQNTEIVLVRHGSAENPGSGVHGDRLLTLYGRRQCAEVALRFAYEAIAGRPFAGGYHAGQPRCQESASIIASVIGLAIHEHPGLRGPERRIDPARDEPLPQVIPDRAPVSGGESWQDYLDRAGGALLELARQHAGNRVLIVAHRKTIDAAAHAFLRLPPGSSRHAYFDTGPGGVTIWEHQLPILKHADPDGVWVLTQHNDLTHLSGRTQFRA